MSSFAGVYSLAYVTVPYKLVAKRLAWGLVENKFAVRVNIIPQITSMYEWQGHIREDDGFLLMVQTRTEKLDALMKYVKENFHTVSKIISFPISEFSWKRRLFEMDQQSSATD